MNRRPLASGEIYHIYNRGVDKRPIFLDDSYFSRFVSLLKHYLKFDYPYSVLLQRRCKCEDVKSLTLKLETYRWERPLVDVLSMCLMPNHFHLQIKQIVENGISTFMHRLGTSYTNYFNTRHERTGCLFQGAFKSVRVENEGQLLCLNRYVHVNPIAANLVGVKNLVSWEWSSLPEYLGKCGDKDKICNTKEILSYFKDTKSYLDFVLADFKESERHSLEGLALDDDFGWFEELREEKRRRQQKLMDNLRRG